MKEALLQYIWQFQHLNTNTLATVQGQALKIITVGTPNNYAGPDFLQARILLDNIEYHGNIEVHLSSSSWYKHQHHKNKAYDNVILHVVWSYDKPVISKDKTPLPTLELQQYLTLDHLKKYQHLAHTRQELPCAQQLHHISLTTWHTMLKQALHTRLQDKANLITQLLQNNKNDTQQTTYQLLAQNFGFKTNNANLIQLTKYLPLKIIQKNAPKLLNIEALLLGQSGLLNINNPKKKDSDPYIYDLTKTYEYLKHKYKLKTSLTPIQWNFKLRPSNSPFLRIVQLASLLYEHPSPFYTLINTPVDKLHSVLNIKQSAYWQAHYYPGKPSKKPIPPLGQASIHNIIINTIVPLLVTYGKLRDMNHYKERALHILHHLPAEKNNITKQWQKLGMPITTAFESQASIQLLKRFCHLKKCLSCKIGQTLLKQTTSMKKFGL